MTATGLDIAQCTDIGGREEQQDRIAVFERDGARLVVLADGMGGHEGGALAAQAVVDAAGERFRNQPPGPPEMLLDDIVRSAHDRIRRVGAKRNIQPHSTGVLLHLDDGAAWAHVGDSRVYRFRRGRLEERTLDHSIVELQRLQGRITEEEMKTHPDQNRLYQAVGSDADPEPETGGKRRLEPEDGFLLASDGLWENVSTGDLEEVFCAADLGVAVGELVARAVANGGSGCDNVSAVAVRARSLRSRGGGVRSFAELVRRHCGEATRRILS